MSVNMVEQALVELVDRHRALYDGGAIDAKLASVVRAGAHTQLTEGDILRLLRTSRSVFFDAHVEVVSGHHTATYLRFESIARFPELIRLLAQDMVEWIRRTFHHDPVTGIVATTSAAEVLAQGIEDQLHDMMRLRLTLTPYSCDTG
ncbi:MAG TPA: hypothetical protein VKB81_00745, partial [Nitrospira sp.]|nr:hypothetical protein [Nitrospira sp.]